MTLSEFMDRVDELEGWYLSGSEDTGMVRTTTYLTGSGLPACPILAVALAKGTCPEARNANVDYVYVAHYLGLGRRVARWIAAAADGMPSHSKSGAMTRERLIAATKRGGE